MSDVTRTPDLFERLRATTTARIGLGRAGNGLPTKPMLDFQMAHAMARDAVHMAMSEDVLRPALPSDIVSVASRVPDRATFLTRPDLGRRLDIASLERLQPLRADGYDIVIVIADGLSAAAVHAHAVPVATALIERLAGWRIAPIILAHQSRVALADEIGEALGAKLSVILIGERPGLSSADSLGAYLTWGPRLGRADSERNCISNIRPPHGLSHALAADKLAWLSREARVRQTTGISLKDDQATMTLTPPKP